MGKKTFGENLYGKGENPNGQVSQTAEETVFAGRALPPQDWKWNQQADGSRWNGSNPEPYDGVATTKPRRKR